MTEKYIASRELALNGIGQDSYTGPVTVTPGKGFNGDSGFLPVVAVPKDNWQTREVSTKQIIPINRGTKGPGEDVKVPKTNTRRSRIQAAPGSFQR